MTNREAFNLYFRMQVEKSVQSVEELSDIVLMLWQHDCKEGRAGATVNKELNWFWFTYGGRNVGCGIDNVVRWLGMEFNGDLQAEIQKWSMDDSGWAKAVEDSYNPMKGGGDNA